MLEVVQEPLDAFLAVLLEGRGLAVRVAGPDVLGLGASRNWGQVVLDVHSVAGVLQDLRLEREMEAHHWLDEVEVRREGVEEEPRMYAVHSAWGVLRSR